MLGKMIADMIMLPEKIPFEKTERLDSDGGFSEAFRAYHGDWKGEEFTLEGAEGVKIACEVIKNPADSGERKKVMLVCHGQTVTRAGAVKYAKLFYDFGYSIVIFDERYFGKSEGEYCTLGLLEPEDIKHIIGYIRREFGENCFLGLHGESMGAASALRLLDTETPDFVIADCPFADLKLLIHDLAWEKALLLAPLGQYFARRIGLKRCGYDYTSVKPIDSVRQSNVPICFMHGNRDRLINCKHSEMMKAVSNNPLSELHFFEESDHARSIFDYPADYERICRAFILKIESENGI